MSSYLDRICNNESLSKGETKAIFEQLVQGKMDPLEIAGLLVALKAKGESPEEIAGAAEALRESAEPFPAPDYRCADTCGTGGDMSNTINISTAGAIVTSAMGVPVVKHGNRSVSSQCGSADVLEKLGVKIDVSVETARLCLDQAGITFLFAPKYHSGMRFAMPVRKTLGVRTVFNLLGPLANPAKPQCQLVGVYDPSRCVPMARTLGLLGLDTALVVHGSGLDEIAVHDVTTAALWRNGRVTELKIDPVEVGLERYPVDRLRGGDVEVNAGAILRLLEGKGDEAHVASVAINAGAVAWVFGMVDDLKVGVSKALEIISSGSAVERLDKWRNVSNGA